MIIIIGYNKPIDSMAGNKAEIAQEVTIILISYHLLCFTDWMPDLEIRHIIGYSIIALVLSLLLLTILVRACCSIRNCSRKNKRKYLVKRSKKYARLQRQSRKKAYKKGVKVWRKRRQAPKNDDVDIHVDYAESSVENAESSVENAESSVENAESSVENAESSVGNAESSVENAESSFENASPQ